MRSSSIKSLTAVATLALTLTLAVPYAEAKPVQSRGSNRSTITTIAQLIKRYFGINVTGELPGDPIPVAQPAPTVPNVGTDVGGLEGAKRTVRK
ncbi:MAG TPA: hypothetical protein VGQ76_07030 [Thermoanaerobaculia bacterium]|jgi:hypothetical protein|nr:hypothetical protein [Thermoanaerobaculia bacterium]